MTSYEVNVTTGPGAANEAALDAVLGALERGATSVQVKGPALSLGADGALSCTCTVQAVDATTAVVLATQALVDALSAAHVSAKGVRTYQVDAKPDAD